MWVKEIQSICRMVLKCYVKFVECQHYDTFFANKFLINYIIYYTQSKIYVLHFFLQVVTAFDCSDMFLSSLLRSWQKAENGSNKSH